MKEMGRQFVLGETIGSAMDRAAGMEAKGYTYSYDMLGEAAITEADARRYHLNYTRAILAIASACIHNDIRANPGISIKLSALHPRYERAQEKSVLRLLVPRLRALALLAKSAGMGLNIDAEEADRLSLSLQVIDAVLGDEALSGWDGFGVVVQAYAPRAGNVIGGGDWAQDRLIPDIISSLLKDEILEIRNPSAIRPWQHVLEPLCGYLILAEKLFLKEGDAAGAWNFGPRDEDTKSVKWVVENLSAKWGATTNSKLPLGHQPHEANFLKLDISKARLKLGWQPKWSLDTALNKIVDWQQSWCNHEDMRAKCITQIYEYNETEVLS